MVEITNVRQMQLTEIDMLIEMDKVCKKHGLEYSLGYGTVLGAVRHGGFIPWDTDIDILVGIDDYKRFCQIINRETPDKFFVFSKETDKSYEFLMARLAMKNKYHHPVHIDIFPMVGVPDNNIGRILFTKLAFIIFKAHFIKMVNANFNYENKRRKKTFANIAKFLLTPVPVKLLVHLFEKLSKAFPLDKSDVVYNFCGTYGYKELISKDYLQKLIQTKFEGSEFPIPEEWHNYLEHFYGDYMIPKQQ